MMHARLVGTALAVWMLVAFLAPSARAQGDYTDTPGVPEGMPGAARMPALVEAYNSGDADQIGAAVRAHFSGAFAEAPAHEHAEVWGRHLASTGPLEIVGFRTYDPPRDQLVAILRSTVTGGYHAIVAEVEADEPHMLTMMYFAPARRPSFLEPVEPLEGEALGEAVDALIDRMTEADMFSGTVAISKDGEVVYTRAAGLASRRFDVPNRMDTKFNMGSMNKMFTAVAIATLEEQGKLSYDDTVGAHLPDYPNEDVRDRVQIRHLLSHTSGMGSHFTEEFMNSSKVTYRSIDDYITLFVDDELAFDPGTRWAYSNAGFYLLGKIVEAASGTSYYDYVRESLCGPAGMGDSDSYDMDIPVKNLAIGYTPGGVSLNKDDDGRRWLEGRGWTNNYFLHSIKGGPAGGGFSTSPDLLAFAKALQGGELVSASTLSMLTSAKPELGSEGYGFGFGLAEHPVLGARYGHNGGFPGINAELRMYPHAGYSVAVMTNMDGAASAVAQQIEMMLAGQ
ncbi:MAG: hypothetical protein DHS20C14_07980 [Phycisphaeraceae bacterium]|nr:MAG: hypothetical protein DHS20C14_07980 [Phycisphaeraceae bacterium]